ncbi:Peptidase S8/S53 domain-containing protein [Artemisia annua]|uniref:Peptidase S8/S53 domain-containing protein n=1 Tax=Artemisia annua TaxID=35608 RepID=A0A2U1LG74_ARTAN|nr:Peptidase S8/S53 domain-containing protein [Artemisia annua]
MNPINVVLMAVMVTFCYSYVAAEWKNNQKTYIVHMDKSVMPSMFSDHLLWYETSMRSVSEYTNMLYTYDTVIHGFSTRLTVDEAKLLEQQHGIVSVQEETIYKLQTTHSPEFLGLEKNDVIHQGSRSGSDVIVGVVDTGVWPGSKSLDDTGFGPIPRSWKGECESGPGFSEASCNKKLIGARSFSIAYEATYGAINEKVGSKSPMDDSGHGTHTSTTAVGSTVTHAGLFGFANGTARGMAPHARLAVYKACWLEACLASDILAAMESAITDGVNILSVSLVGSYPDYTSDVVAHGAFKAVSRGIFVSCAAGNDGPTPLSLSNTAPWIATVGAGTLDRDFPAYVTLGNGKKFSGVSLYSGKPLSSKMVPLVFAGDVSNSTMGNYCVPGSLPQGSVTGKIVMCERGVTWREKKGMVVKAAGGVGMILANTNTFGEELVADSHFIPSTAIGQKAGDAIKNYLISDRNPMSTITSGGTILGIQPSPVVAAFSSRGPNQLTPEILKPDLIAPGVNILAGWTNKVGPTGLSEDPRRVEFNIVSGTSMSCPHVSGLAALLKEAHPEWSPAAIKSALMTTAYNTYKTGEGIKDVATGKPSTPFDHGAGHVDPVSALDPGLVYDASPGDYLSFLCALNFSSTTMKIFAGGNSTCIAGKKYRIEDLNYPSFAVPLHTASGKGGGSKAPTVVKYTRSLTNVGTPATYKVSVVSKMQAVKINVEPEELTFIRKNEKKVYTVTFTASSRESGTTGFASLAWSGGKYVVRSPIAFSWA